MTSIQGNGILLPSWVFTDDFNENLSLDQDNSDFGDYRILYNPVNEYDFNSTPDIGVKAYQSVSKINYKYAIIINLNYLLQASERDKKEAEKLKKSEKVEKVNLNQEKFRNAIFDLSNSLKGTKLKIGKIFVSEDIFDTEISNAILTDVSSLIIESAILAKYHYKDEEVKKFHWFELLSSDSRKCSGQGKAEIHGHAQNHTRFLTEAPANIISPTGFINYIKKLIVKYDLTNDIEVIVRDKDWMKVQNMNLILSVASGSIDVQPPYFLEMHLNRKKNEISKPKLALIGKGITFDTGANTLKHYSHMEDMRTDMGGAAICALTIISLARTMKANKIKSENGQHICALCPMTENMIDGNAMRPLDVVTSHSGKTVCLTDLDAEGRLVMADALSYADKELKAEYLIDIATLTGAVETALGHISTGVWTTNSDFYGLLEKSGYNTCERFHNLPLYQIHRERMEDTRYADITNYIEKPPGATNAAAFLSAFHNNENWLHIDVGGSMENKNNACKFISETFSGRPVRAIVDLAEKMCL